MWEFNYELINIIIGILKVNKPLILNKIDDAPKEDKYNLKFTKPYLQVFSNKIEFEPNLSVLDLIFNVGPQSINHLT